MRKPIQAPCISLCLVSREDRLAMVRHVDVHLFGLIKTHRGSFEHRSRTGHLIAWINGVEEDLIDFRPQELLPRAEEISWLGVPASPCPPPVAKTIGRLTYIHAVQHATQAIYSWISLWRP